MDDLTQYENEAREMGRRAGIAAASWVFDGNTSPFQVERMVKWMDDGDPQYEQYLPARPNLSGEWADDPTPGTLAYEITGLDSDYPGFDQIVDAIADAWEAGVDETFEVECERILREALSE
jgi:hypothetical protein